MKPVVIVGGGVSGLAAGVALSSRGTPVILLEQKPSLGGRAYSYTDATTGDTADNGQHVLIAGYTSTMRFLDRIGTRHLVSVSRRPALVFHHPERGVRRFTLPMLPSPLHLLWGSLTTSLVSPADRLRLLRAGVSLWRCTGVREQEVAGMTIDRWLASVGQSEECRRSFWEPLAVAIMNEHIGTAAAAPFLRALRTAFLGGWRDAAMSIPLVGLSALFADPAASFIRDHGGTVECGADVVRTLSADGIATGVQLRNGREIPCSAMILAVSPDKIGAILPEELSRRGFLSSVRDITFSPIVSIHLWFARDFMEEDVVGVIGRRIQWLFNKRSHAQEIAGGGRVSATISAAHEFVDRTNSELVDLAVRDLHTMYGNRVGDPLHAVVIREKRATYSSTPEAERRRPDARTPMANLFLAGDWTATGFPATIEGAVMSAECAAALVVAFVG